MAKGFWAGLVQGTVVSAAALAVLSLAVPQQDTALRDRETTTPAAENLTIPAGSEFGRGTDEVPLMPEPLSRPDTQALGDAPAAMAPAADPVPTPTTTTAERPETRDIEPEAPRAISPVEEPGELPEASSAEARVPVSAPERVETPAQDAMPAQLNAESSAPPAAIAAQQVPAEAGMHSDLAAAPVAQDHSARSAAPTAPEPSPPDAAPSTEGVRGDITPDDTTPTLTIAAPEPLPAEQPLAQVAERNAGDILDLTSSPAAADTSLQGDRPAHGFPGLDLSVPPDLGGLNLSN